MKLEWMGENRGLIEQMIRYGNVYAHNYKKRHALGDISLSAAELQVLEYLLENEEEKQNMASVARRLGIATSTFTKLVGKLTGMGLLEKYHTAGNKKSVIVLVSGKGKTFYEAYVHSDFTAWVREINALLAGVPRKHVAAFERVMEVAAGPAATEELPAENGGPELIPLARPRP